MALRAIYRRAIPRRWRGLIRAALPWQQTDWALSHLEQNVLKDRRAISGTAGLLVRDRFPELVAMNSGRSPINAHEWRVYSQNGEDGIIAYLLCQVGVTNRTFVEFGIEMGRECNTANLAINFGWSGLLMDADADAIPVARRHYAEMLLPGRKGDVTIIQARITPENINAILQRERIPPEIDLMSIDIDSDDYWVWQALTATSPRVVAIEYNAMLGPYRSVTVPKGLVPRPANRLYFGASLAALHALGAQKGYVFVGCDSQGVNAFFVRRDVAAGRLDEQRVADAWYPLSHVEMSLEEIDAALSLLQYEEV